jgi:hypothetical protein
MTIRLAFFSRLSIGNGLWSGAQRSKVIRDIHRTPSSIPSWPQSPTPVAVKAVAEAVVEFRQCRSDLQTTHGLSLRDLYRSLDQPGASSFKDALTKLDNAVRAA